MQGILGKICRGNPWLGKKYIFQKSSCTQNFIVLGVENARIVSRELRRAGVILLNFQGTLSNLTSFSILKVNMTFLHKMIRQTGITTLYIYNIYI